MKKTILLLCAFTASVCAVAQTGASFFQSGSMTKVSKVSPNGKYAVGSDMEPKEWAAGSVEYFSSFIWDLKTGAIDWLTEFDQADYNKSGCFTDVNDDMTICGYFKSPNHKATLTNSNGMSFILPLNVAALWMDGKLHPSGSAIMTRAYSTMWPTAASPRPFQTIQGQW